MGDDFMSQPTAQQAFVMMLHDRLIKNEAELSTLKARCDRQLAATISPPYKKFDDGYDFIWALGEFPRMLVPGTTRSEPLDIKHGNAILYENDGAAFSFGSEVMLRPEDLDEDDDPNEPYPIHHNVLLRCREATVERFCTEINRSLTGSMLNKYVHGRDWSLEIRNHRPYLKPILERRLM